MLTFSIQPLYPLRQTRKLEESSREPHTRFCQVSSGSGQTRAQLSDADNLATEVVASEAIIRLDHLCYIGCVPNKCNEYSSFFLAFYACRLRRKFQAGSHAPLLFFVQKTRSAGNNIDCRMCMCSLSLAYDATTPFWWRACIRRKAYNSGSCGRWLYWYWWLCVGCPDWHRHIYTSLGSRWIRFTHSMSVG